MYPHITNIHMVGTVITFVTHNYDIILKCLVKVCVCLCFMLQIAKCVALEEKIALLDREIALDHRYVERVSIKYRHLYCFLRNEAHTCCFVDVYGE